MALRDKERVCATGAGGFLASWLVKLLLSKNYIVHGTVRRPGDEKYAHLMKLDKASENLQLFQADMLDYDSLHSAIEGCTGVFHVATPVPYDAPDNPEVEMIEPAVKGTQNVLKACLSAKIKRVIVVSSGAAVYHNPRWPKDQLKDESCWSDKEYCRSNKMWYPLSKTEAETESFEFAREHGLDVVTVCPVYVYGPLLQPTVNASSLMLVNILKGAISVFQNVLPLIVDVRDVAEALLLAYVKPEAQGRYICSAYAIQEQDLVVKLKSLYPNYDYPKSFDEAVDGGMSSEKLQKLGWIYRPLEETLIDSIESYKKSGVFD